MLRLWLLFLPCVFAFAESDHAVIQERAKAAANPCPAAVPETTEMAATGDKNDPYHCYGACGRGCKCSGRVTYEETVKVGDSSCVYQVVSCRTHEFCQWHDACYDKCARLSGFRKTCLRGCDQSCITGFAPPSFSANFTPGDPPGRYSARQCTNWAAGSGNAISTGRLTFSRLKRVEEPELSVDAIMRNSRRKALSKDY